MDGKCSLATNGNVGRGEKMDRLDSRHVFQFTLDVRCVVFVKTFGEGGGGCGCCGYGVCCWGGHDGEWMIGLTERDRVGDVSNFTGLGFDLDGMEWDGMA